jgi:hypothetical protein
VGDIETMRFPTSLLLSTFCAVLVALIACSDTSTTDSDEDNDLPLSPENCEVDRPPLGPLKVKVTIDGEFKTVPITVYRGDIEDNVIELETTMTKPERTLQMDVNRDYSVIALYVIGPDTVAVLDSDDISRENKEYRDRYCWEVPAATVDLRLRIRP